MTITVTIHAKIDADRKAELTTFLEENLPNTRSARGCRLVEVFFDQDNSELVLNEEWVSAEDHQHYVSVISANGVFEQLLGFLSGEPTTRYLKKTTL